MKGILSVRAFLAAGLLAAIAASCSETGAPPVAPEESGSPAPGAAGILGARQVDAYIVTVADRGLTPASGRRLVTARMVDAVEATGGTVAREWPQIGRALVRGISEAEATALAKVPGVESVVRDVVLPWIPKPAQVERIELDEDQVAILTANNPTDAAFWDDFQWNMKIIQVDDAFAVQKGDPSILVAILDTGITAAHLDMQGNVNLALSRSMINTGADPTCPHADQTRVTDFNFHGTHVASLVKSNNIGTASVAPYTGLIGVKVLNCRGSGSFADIIDGILYAASLPVDVINMSLGVPGGVPDTPANQPLIDAVGDAVGVAIDADVVVVNSAGNDGRQLFPRGSNGPGGGVNNILVPGQTHPDIVIVSATGPVNQKGFDRLASYSNFGEPITVAAPGGDFIAGNVLDFVLGVCSPTQIDLPFTCGFGSYVFVVGTSQAAPHASGVLALIDAETGGSQENLRRQLAGTADSRPGTSFTHGAGRVNAFSAVQP